MAVLEKQPAKSLELQPGPYWESFEKFRVAGAKQLSSQLPPGQVGRLNVKGQSFVVMRADTFAQLHGLASDAERYREVLHLVEQAVQLLMHTDDSSDAQKLALEHLHDLTTHLSQVEEQAPKPRELVFDEDERASEIDDFELNPAKVRRPTFEGVGS